MKRVFTVVFCLSCIMTNMSRGQSPVTGPEVFLPVSVPGSQLRTFKSTSTGRDYDIYVHIPASYEKETSRKYPVEYILDGQWDFKLMDSILGGLVYDKFVPEMILLASPIPARTRITTHFEPWTSLPSRPPTSKGQAM